MTECVAAVQYSNAARVLLGFCPLFSEAVDVLRKECQHHLDIVVTADTDHPHGIKVLARFSKSDGTFSVDVQSSRSPTPCIFSADALLKAHQLGFWAASVPMNLDAVFSAVYSHTRPAIDPEADMSEIQDRIVQAEDGIPFKISSYSVERVFQKLMTTGGTPCEGLGVMYQTHRPDRVRMLIFKAFVLRVYNKK